MSPHEADDSWSSWANKVLTDIERIDENNKILNKKLNELCIKLAILETKAVVIGGISGAIVSIISAVIAALIISHMKG